MVITCLRKNAATSGDLALNNLCNIVINAKYIVEADLFSGLTNSLGMALGGLFM